MIGSLSDQKGMIPRFLLDADCVWVGAVLSDVLSASTGTDLLNRGLAALIKTYEATGMCRFAVHVDCWMCV